MYIVFTTFRNEISRFLQMGYLDHVYCSFSRDDIDSKEPGHTKYVQENIRKHKTYIMQLFIEKEGIVFICG